MLPRNRLNMAPSDEASIGAMLRQNLNLSCRGGGECWESVIAKMFFESCVYRILADVKFIIGDLPRSSQVD